MEYQKIKTCYIIQRTFKYRTKNWVEINGESRGNMIIVTLNLKLQ